MLPSLGKRLSNPMPLHKTIWLVSYLLLKTCEGKILVKMHGQELWSLLIGDKNFHEVNWKRMWSEVETKSSKA